MNSKSQPYWLLVLAIVATVLAHTNRSFAQTASASANTAEAPTDASQLGSLMRMPESTGLYFSTMNHKAVIESIFESNAYKAIKASEVARGMKKAYRRGRTRGYDDYNRRNPFAEYLQGYGDSIDNVIFQSVWQIARQVVDNELFIYVDNDMLPVIDSIQMTQAKMLERFNLGGDLDFEGLTEEQAADLIEMISQSVESLECPTMMIGSRLDNPQGFRGMLELGRSAAEQAMRSLPEELDIIHEFWQVVDEEDNFLLTVDIDMSELPWDELLKDVDADKMKMALGIRDAVSTKKATVAMGIVDNLLVLGLAKDRTRLTEFGNGAKMIDLDSLKPLRKAIDQNKKLVGVFYMSPQYAEASYSLEKTYQQLKPMVRPIISQFDEIPDNEKEKWITQIETEANEFISDFGQLIPPRATSFGFATLDDDGVRGYSQVAAKHPMLDGSKSLNLAKHANPDTIAFFNQRLYRLSDQYALLSKWTSKLYRYGRDIALKEIEKNMGSPEASPAAVAESKAMQADNRAEDDQLDEFNRELSDQRSDKKADRSQTDAIDKGKSDLAAGDTADKMKDQSDNEPDFETIKSFMSDIEALVVRFDQITRTKLLPAIDGQEAGFFVDAISGPNPWHPDMPVAQAPLPLPFPAFVVGTNDSKAVTQAGEEYWKLADDLLTSAKKHFPEEEVKEAFLLPPNRLEKNGDVSFRWSFLHDFGQVDSSVQPGTMINDNWVVLNAHPDQAKRLTQPQNDQRLFGPADTDEASIGLAFYDHRVAMKSLRTWIDYAETQIPADESPFNLAERYPAERDTLQFTEPQLRDAFERTWTFAKCWKGVSGRTYEEADSTITEYLLKFEDIAEQ